MSSLRKSLEEYLATRRAAGFALHDTATALNGFVAFAEQQGDELVTTRLALEWAQLPADAQPGWWTRRLGMVRLFARHLSAQEPRTEIPPTGLLPRGYRRQQPYLYSDEEVDCLRQAARNLPSSTGLRAWTYATFLGLLAATGMRMGEAIHLDREDVDLEQGLLTLRHTKLGKERYVPIHPTTQKALLDYQTYRDRIYPRAKTSSFFLAEHGRRLGKESVRATFVKLLRQIGLRGPDQSRSPRLQDLRHRFAVRTMINWYRAGADVEAQLPKLSTYLGHVNVHSTYWYLTAVPELLQLATARLSGNFSTQEQNP
jgi:integrase/recombinase XerD